MGKNVTVSTHPRGWSAKKDGASRASVVTDTQRQAVDAGRKIAQSEKSELVVKGVDGRIRQKDSFGSDPRKTKG